VFIFRNKASFYGEELSTPRPTHKLEDHPLSAVRNCLFNGGDSDSLITGVTDAVEEIPRHIVEL